MAETPTKFPEVQGGGSLIIAWQVKGKKVLVVGGGQVGGSPKPGKVASTMGPAPTDIPPDLTRSPRVASSTVSMPTPT